MPTAGFLKTNKKCHNNLPSLESEVRHFHYSCNPSRYIPLLSFQGLYFSLAVSCALSRKVQ